MPQDERVHVLTTLYQSDRSDRASTLNVSLATMGAAVTYLIGTIAFYDKLDTLGWTIALLPLPLVCVAAFHSLLVNVAGIRARSILHLEAALLDAVETRPAGERHIAIDRTLVGVTASEAKTNIHTAPTVVRVTTMIAYGGIGIIYLGYIVLMLWRAARHVGGWVAIPAAGYLALLVPTALSWRQSMSNLDVRDRRTREPGQNAGPDTKASTSPTDH